VALTIYDYFERACRRPLRAVDGALVRDVDGNCTVFSVRIDAGRIVELHYQSTTCTTLVALCEHLCELVKGLEARAVIEMQPETLLALHPEIPEPKRATAALALEALKSAVQRSDH
jgi:NifU-like protein involved in Fe-S cluster formation